MPENKGPGKKVYRKRKKRKNLTALLLDREMRKQDAEDQVAADAAKEKENKDPKKKKGKQ